MHFLLRENRCKLGSLSRERTAPLGHHAYDDDRSDRDALPSESPEFRSSPLLRSSLERLRSGMKSGMNS